MRKRSSKPPRFEPGRIVITRRAFASLPPADVLRALSRHLACDWGETSLEDRRENDLSVERDLRLFSVYHASDGTRFWIITEADRSATTILLPEDY